jgi:hypothetical protein
MEIDGEVAVDDGPPNDNKNDEIEEEAADEEDQQQQQQAAEKKRAAAAEKKWWQRLNQTEEAKTDERRRNRERMAQRRSAPTKKERAAAAEITRKSRQNQSQEAYEDAKKRSRERMARRSPAQKAAASKRTADTRKQHRDQLRDAKREYGIPLRRAAVVPITTPSHFTILVASPEVQKHFFLAPTATDFPANDNAATGVAMDSVVVEPSPELMLSGGFLNVAVATGYLPWGVQRHWFEGGGSEKQVDGQSCSLYRMLKTQDKALIYAICRKAQVTSDAPTIHCINVIFTSLFFILSNRRLQIDPTTLPSILYTPKPTLEASNVCSNYYGDNDANKAHEAITSLMSSLSVIKEAGGFPTKYGYSHCTPARHYPLSQRGIEIQEWYRARYPIDLCRQPINITTQELTVQEWSAITKMRNAPFNLSLLSAELWDYSLC